MLEDLKKKEREKQTLKSLIEEKDKQINNLETDIKLLRQKLIEKDEDFE